MVLSFSRATYKCNRDVSSYERKEEKTRTNALHHSYQDIFHNKFFFVDLIILFLKL